MALFDTPQQVRAETRAARSRKARAWAWPVRIMLLITVAAAIWQEPRLWPQGHAAMQGGVETIAGVFDGKDRVRSFVASLSGRRTGGGEVGLADKLAEALAR